jgi:adapter protein MecA 1/2
MQLEKKDDKNLYCYITGDDFLALNITPNTLAYGSNSYRKLLSAIMTRANEECSFTANDHPLLVEAVPLDNGEFFIQISAIEEAEELDPRFAQFAPGIFDDFDPEEDDAPDDEAMTSDNGYPLDEASEKISFPEIPEMPAFSGGKHVQKTPLKGTIYCFSTYEALLSALRSVGEAQQFMQLRSSLYYHPGKKKYYIVLGSHRNTPGVRALLAAFCEHANTQPLTSTAQAWLAEHARCIIRTHAIPRLIEAVTNNH